MTNGKQLNLQTSYSFDVHLQYHHTNIKYVQNSTMHKCLTATEYKCFEIAKSFAKVAQRVCIPATYSGKNHEKNKF